MLNILVSYFKRTKRTPVRVVVFLCPLLFSFIFTAYLQTSTKRKGNHIILCCIYHTCLLFNQLLCTNAI